MRDITRFFPRSWRFVAMILEDGKPDDYGNPRPEVAHMVPDCLIGPASTKDLQDFSQMPRDILTMYGPTMMEIQPTSRVFCPPGRPSAGLYRVNGRPGEWPLGTATPVQFVAQVSNAMVDKYNRELAKWRETQ